MLDIGRVEAVGPAEESEDLGSNEVQVLEDVYMSIGGNQVNKKRM